MNRHYSRTLLVAGLLAALLSPHKLQAVTVDTVPLFMSASVQPLVMLDISKDHELWKKAYNDYSDLNGDGQLESTYTHSINYYGYFDPGKCYTYSAANQRFEPASVSPTKYCTGQWSGNFLNWATMSRMDAVRKLLYGGHRSTDQTFTSGGANAVTVLERAYIPPDAHAWAKYYDGSDLAQLTPYAPVTTSTTSSSTQTINNTGTNTINYAFTVVSATGFAVGDFVHAFVTGGATNFLKGQITAIVGSDITLRVANANYGGSGKHSSWTLNNLSTRGLTVCNVTTGANGTYSQNNTDPPQIYFAAGNHSLWNANEANQCLWDKGINNNNFDHSGIPASSIGPTLATHGAGTGLGSYVARVQVCVPGLLGGEKCKQYPNGNYKPVGLLQVYGDTDQIRFGLMTGSYRRNISGGVLRKNIGTFTDEVNVNTDGTFTTTVGIVKTLDRLRLYGFRYGSGYDPNGTAPDNVNNCSYRVTTLAESAGSCTSSWGNPMAELYFESLRYFANDGTYSPLYDFTYAGSKDEDLQLPQPAWNSPITQANYCAPLNTLVFNTSVTTDDRDLKDDTMTSIGNASTAGALTDTVGSGEGITGSYFIGANASTNTGRCDGKNVSSLGSIYGICPEGPTLEGSYLIAGLSHHARTHKIRSGLTVPGTDTKSLKVTTYGIQLATNVPRVAIALSGEATPRVILQPAYWMYDNAQQGGGALVDMKIVSQNVTSTTASGTLYVNYETSEAGADYDQDAWGIIRYCLTTVANGCGTGTAANTISVTTDIIAESAGSQQGFGYTISGTTQDGAHFHSGTDGFNFTDPTGVLGCANCVVGNAATSVTYTLGITSTGILKDPLYYAAKWGGFNDLNSDGVPNSALEWDVLTTTGTPGSDGIPDNYFLVSNPLGLETALNSAFLKILKDSSASAVATNSSTLNTGSRLFQGRFSNTSWSGQLLSYRLDINGNVLSAASPPPAWDPAETPYPEWDAGQQIRGQASTSTDNRLILTLGSTGDGATFEYSNLTSGQKTLLNQDASLNTDNCGPERVNYLRGQSQHEGVGTFTCASSSTIQRFRSRPVSILGDIVNSNPVFVGPPSAGYADVDHPGYSAFRNKFLNRKPVVYVGANDGMLHGFDVSVNNSNQPTADAGKEVIAYVPSSVYDYLTRLTSSAYTSGNNHRYFVDGSPMMADACVSASATCSNTWKTVLIGSLGAGGRGFFALNITNPNLAGQDSTDTPEFKTTRAADIVLWEFTNSDDAELGLTFNQSPTNINTGQSRQIVKFQNGRWGVVVGNGYNGGNGGKAILYVLFLSGPTGTVPSWQVGTDYIKIVADVGPDNGLSTPNTFDANGDGLIDTVYAGDLKGNIWKFDLSNSNPASWAVGNGGAALFSAGTTQPITTPPEVTLHPSGGAMVLFGTGRYLGGTDPSSTSVQTLYGIHDNGATVSLANLSPVQIGTTTINSTTYRTTSTVAGCGRPAATCSGTVQGWYADLPTSRERATGTPRLTGSTIFFNTFIPSASPCEFGGTGWLMALNYYTGLMQSFPMFDTNASGSVGAGDAPVAGLQIGAALGGTTLIRSVSGSGAGVGISSLTTGQTAATQLGFGAGFQGRITWREIIE